MVHGSFLVFFGWSLQRSTLSVFILFLPMVESWQKRQEQCEERGKVEKRAVKSGRVGERAKEALVDGLNGLDGLSMMLVWEGLFFLAEGALGALGTSSRWWEWRGGVFGEGS